MSTHRVLDRFFFVFFSFFYFMLGRFNKYNVMLNEKGKARGEDSTCLPVRDLPLCSTHHQFLDLRAPRRHCRRVFFAKSA